jgi:hypothetical protein
MNIAGLPELGPYGSVRGARGNSRPYRDQRWIFARDGLSANDPTATLAVQCGNGFDAGLSPYQSTRLIRYDAVSLT